MPRNRSRRTTGRAHRVAWWQPAHPVGAVLAPLVAALAYAAIVALTHHVHVHWQ